jgi:hypothetical protein
MEVKDAAGSLTPRGALRFFVGTPPAAIHGRTRLTRHPCRVAQCLEPALDLVVWWCTHSPVGAAFGSSRYSVICVPPGFREEP